MLCPYARFLDRRALVSMVQSLIALAGIGLALTWGPLPVRSDVPAHSHEHGSTMGDMDMGRSVKDWYAKHPIVGAGHLPAGADADTFVASGTRFDTDQNPASQVDTAFILTGQSILWVAFSGAHSVTNGAGSLDANAGTLFDAPIDFDFNPTFQYLFDTAGVYPFFCRPHEGFNMRGVVVVKDPPPAPADTFLTGDTQFDTDGNLATQVDTAFIQAGQIVMWTLISGSHTVTNGDGSTDPSAGLLFDVPLDGTHQSFVFPFPDNGVFPFFCRTHENFNMQGVVVVGGLVSAPLPAGVQLGFATEPVPNPTTGAVRFRLAMPVAGRASLQVFDSRGHLVASPLDRLLDAGVSDAGWNGLTRDGAHASPGVYYLRLTLPGVSASRRVVLAQ